MPGGVHGVLHPAPGEGGTWIQEAGREAAVSEWPAGVHPSEDFLRSEGFDELVDAKTAVEWIVQKRKGVDVADAVDDQRFVGGVRRELPRGIDLDPARGR